MSDQVPTEPPGNRVHFAYPEATECAYPMCIKVRCLGCLHEYVVTFTGSWENCEGCPSCKRVCDVSLIGDAYPAAN